MKLVQLAEANKPQNTKIHQFVNVIAYTPHAVKIEDTPKS